MNRPLSITRRSFIEQVSTVTAGVSVGAPLLVGRTALAAETPVAPATAESLVGRLYSTLSEPQKKAICFDWNHQDPQRGLLRTFVANNWNITPHEINDDFYSDEQRDLIKQVFESIIHPDWHERYYQQLEDDAGGFGNEQSIAIFGTPGSDQFKMVMTGRHLTLRCDGNSTDHVAFGGPIFYGHAPEFNEGPSHTGNVFWHQAIAANNLYKMLDGRHQSQALVARTPREQAVGFKGKKGDFTGLPVSDMSSDQQQHMQEVLQTLIEPYRQTDRDEVVACLKTQGGLQACRLSFYRDHDIGDDQVWDNWRLEGPAFVWHYRGAPHVHVWVNVADDPSVETNS